MSDFLTDVEQCLNNSYKLPPATKRLKEPKSKTVITITTHGQFLLYSFDLQLLGRDLFPFFSNKAKLKQVCDYVLFCKRKADDKPFVLIVELKTSMNPTSQLWATKQFVDFLIKRVNAACNTNYDPEIRKIGVLESMPEKLKRKFRSSGTRVGKVMYDSDKMTCLVGNKFAVADYLEPVI